MSSRDLLYNTVLMVNNALLCIKKKLKEGKSQVMSYHNKKRKCSTYYTFYWILLFNVLKRKLI